jgi:hypothetical protein
MTQFNDMDLNDTKPLQNTVEGLNEMAVVPAEEKENVKEESDLSHDSQEDEHDKEGLNNSYITELTKELEGITDSEIKLQKAIEFMEKSLSQNGTPHFKSFWQARDICLQLFKENISPASRTIHWNKYSELSKEARRLKVLLDEQSAFAVEQIEIAIQALETALTQLDQPADNQDAPSIECKALFNSLPYYLQIQNELNHLNTHATRINALRKELIKTEMRVRKKNKFFQRLSQAGDKVFPRRKELIKDISDHFIKDVDLFISVNFTENKMHDPLFVLRDEIKNLQGVAKSLTLNTHAFTHTRMRLSECWDKLKHMEKERKHERAQQKAAFKHNVDAVIAKIDAFNQSIQTGEVAIQEANKQLDEISDFMRSVELGRDEVRFLREQLANARQPVLDMMKSQEEKRMDLEREKVRQKQQKIIDLKQEIEKIIKSNDSYDAESLLATRETLIEKIQSSTATKLEKLELEKMLKPLRDIISEKREKALMSLSDDDRNALQQLREVLKQRLERRQEVKDQLESLRKLAGTSGLDFERAMEYTALLNEEKERLEKINLGINEIEQKVSALEKKA